MNDFQWYWEFMSLREKEKEELDLTKSVLQAVKNMLINILGLDLMRTKEEGEEKEDESFIPLSLVAGRREVVEHILESIDKDRIQEEFIDDEEFEEISKTIAQSEGDMVPIIDDDIDEVNEAIKRSKQEDLERQMQALGIKKTSKSKNVAHMNLDVAKIRSKIAENKIARANSKSEIEKLQKEAEEEKRKMKKQGVKVTFDENPQ